MKDKYRICVVSAANGKIEDQYSLTNPNKSAYCDMHGYDYKFTQLDGGAYVGDPHFSKYELVEKELRGGSYDYVIWMDADAWFNNSGIALSEVIDRYSGPDTALIIARDQGMLGCDERLLDYYVNTGVMVFKTGAESLELLRKYAALREDQTVCRMIKAFTPLHDQPYMCLLALGDEYAKRRISIAKPDALNAFAWCGFSENTFICHVPSKWAKARLKDYMKTKSSPMDIPSVIPVNSTPG